MTDRTEIPDPSSPHGSPGTGSATSAMARRYGTDRRRGRLVGLALGGLLVAALTAWAIWAASSQEQAAIEAQVTSYHVVGTHEIQVKIATRFRDASADGTCLVRATARDHTVVGEENLTAAELRAARGHWISVRTERRATTVAVVRCTD